MVMFFIILGVTLWIFLSLAPAFIARNKGYSLFLFWIISLFFWWITLFVAIFMKPRELPGQPSNEA